MPREEWRPAPGWPRYEVSSHGRVRHRGVSAVLTQHVDTHGYLTVRLGRMTVRVHALVAAAFIGPRPPGLQVRHLNSRQRDNRAVNLAYGSQVDQEADKRRLKLNLGGQTQGPEREDTPGRDGIVGKGSARRASSPAQTSVFAGRRHRYGTGTVIGPGHG